MWKDRVESKGAGKTTQDGEKKEAAELRKTVNATGKQAEQRGKIRKKGKVGKRGGASKMKEKGRPEKAKANQFTIEQGKEEQDDNRIWCGNCTHWLSEVRWCLSKQNNLLCIVPSYRYHLWYW